VDEGVKIPGLIRSHLLPWASIENIVLKRDFVTIFQHDKKFIQLEVAQDVSTIEIEKLTTFSKQQIEASFAEEKS
ncbi:MAG: hypothetical protein JWP88_237, partial [Flaviaesturariibacter sp.]|nr:hypothetical protein [Flaviaesturariibacter sp.]